AVPGHTDAVLGEQLVVFREDRLLLLRAHVGEDQPTHFHARVARVLHGELEVRFGRLGRGVDAVAGAVVAPAVVETADALLLDTAVVEGRAAVAAVLGDEARLAGAVAEEDDVLAKNFDPQR